MGNNHSKYFPKKLRKVIIIGPAASGKTTLFRLIDAENYEKDEYGSSAPYVPTDKFSN